MPKSTISRKRNANITHPLCLPKAWLVQIDYMAQQQDQTRSEHLRELIRFGGDMFGLDLQ